jgi:hypothetical protein
MGTAVTVVHPRRADFESHKKPGLDCSRPGLIFD